MRLTVHIIEPGPKGGFVSLYKQPFRWLKLRANCLRENLRFQELRQARKIDAESPAVFMDWSRPYDPHTWRNVR